MSSGLPRASHIHANAGDRQRERFGSGRRSFIQAKEVFRNLGLELPDFVQWALSEHGKVARILWQNVGAIGFQDPLHPAHLFEGLLELARILDHEFNIRMPFRNAGWWRTC
jgi:hypothetical protein